MVIWYEMSEYLSYDYRHSKAGEDLHGSSTLVLAKDMICSTFRNLDISLGIGLATAGTSTIFLNSLRRMATTTELQILK